jgi:hypothetical protein
MDNTKSSTGSLSHLCPCLAAVVQVTILPAVQIKILHCHHVRTAHFTTICVSQVPNLRTLSAGYIADDKGELTLQLLLLLLLLYSFSFILLQSLNNTDYMAQMVG